MGALDDLTSNMNQLKDGKTADLKLSTESRDAYLKAIRACGDSLKAERAKMNSLETLAYPGSFGSAVQTQRNLQDDVTGLAGIQRTLDKYLDYLDAFEATVKNTADLILKSG